jgi:hypothetical protein
MRPTGADANNMNHRNNGPYVGKLFTHSDERGSLGVAEFSGLPFVPKRFFWLHAVSEGSTRASHGHRECEQLVFVQQGTVSGFTLDATNSRMSFELGVAEFVYVPTRHWLQLENFSDIAVVGVLASHPFDADEYIDSPDELNS